MTKILIVDDDISIREMLRAFFESDFEILLASNGLEALEKNIINQPDVIISDLRMPVMDGFELLSKVSTLNKPIPVVIMTGTNNIPPEDLAFIKSRKSFAGIVKKPFSFKDLRDKIEAVL